MNKSRKFDPLSIYLCCFLGLVTAAAILTQAIWSGWRLPFNRPIVVQARPLVSLPTTSALILQMEPTAFCEERTGELVLDRNVRVPLPQTTAKATADASPSENRFCLGASAMPPVTSVSALTQEFFQGSSANDTLADYAAGEPLNTGDQKTVASRGRQESLLVQVADPLTGKSLGTVQFRSE